MVSELEKSWVHTSFTSAQQHRLGCNGGLQVCVEAHISMVQSVGRIRNGGLDREQRLHQSHFAVPGRATAGVHGGGGCSSTRMCQNRRCSTGKLSYARKILHAHTLTQLQRLQVSVLADTSYNSLSVDEVAAQHAQADCVVSCFLVQFLTLSSCSGKSTVFLYILEHNAVSSILSNAGALWQGVHESSVMLASILCLWSATPRYSKLR